MHVTRRSRIRRRALRWISAAGAALLTSVILAVTTGSFAQEDVPEYRLKAVYLYKFVSFIDWPAASFPKPDTPVTIGVVGADSLAAELTQAAAGRTANDRPVTVRRLKIGESLEGVHVLFVGRAESARVSQLAPAARMHSVLMVTESDGALAQGSIINFVTAERRVRFEISLDSAEKSRLRLSSRLLAVAQQVHTGTP